MSDPRNVFPDNVYHTLTCRNDENKAITLRFPTNSDSDILSNPMMYYALVQKFSLSSRAIPILTLDNRDGSLFTREAPGGQNIDIVCPAAHYYGDLVKDTSFDPRNVPIYFIQQLAKIIDSSTNANYTFALDIGDLFSINTAQGAPYLAFSPRLYALFPNLPAKYVRSPAGDMYELIFENGTCVQESKGIYALNDISSIILISDSLPIASQGFVTNNNAKQKFKIINQFPIIYNQSSDIDKNEWVFESTEYRPIDFISTNSFTTFDYEIKLAKKNGEVVDYYLLPGESASMTFRFVKKALFNNEYNLSNQTDRIKQNPQYSFNRRI